MNNDKFLQAYKELETELKYIGQSVLDYENSLSDTDDNKEKIKLCRIVRNYISHNSDNFAGTTNEMIKFLNSLTSKINKLSKTAKDIMVKPNFIKPNEPIKNILPLIKKPIVVLDKDKFICVVKKDYLLDLIAAGEKKFIVPKKNEYRFISPKEHIEDLSGEYIVTQDGTNKGKVTGILNV